MIVQCQNCDTRFQLDDERIPLAGIRVRCSRCKESFFLLHPSSEGAGESIGAETGDDSENPFEAGTQQAADLGAAAAPDASFEEEEDDWEFNADVPLGDDSVSGDVASAESPASPAPVLDESIADEPELGDALGEGLADLELEDADLEAEPAIETPVSASSIDTDRDDLSASAEATAESPLELGGEPETSFGSVDEFGALADSNADETSPEEREEDAFGAPGTDPAAGAAGAENSKGDLGDPEDWDFLGGQAPPSSAAAAHEPVQPFSDPPDSPVLMKPPGTASEPPAEPESDRYDPDAGSASWGWMETAGQVAGWTAVAALLAGLLATTLWQRPEPTPPEYRFGSFRAQKLETRWVPTARGRSALVVTGELLNESVFAERPLMRLEIALLDANGAPLDHETIPVGSPLDPRQVRELAPAEQVNARRAAVARLARFAVAPGERRPFAAYVDDVPEDAQRVDLHARADSADELDGVVEPERSEVDLVPDSALVPAEIQVVEVRSESLRP